jgi:hypothetical protein
MEQPSTSPEKRSDEKSVFSWIPVLDLSRTGFALWVWAELIRCHDGLVLCFLGAALTVLQADPCCVIYRTFKKYHWAYGFSLLLWIVLVALTWGVVYKNFQP